MAGFVWCENPLGHHRESGNFTRGGMHGFSIMWQRFYRSRFLYLVAGLLCLALAKIIVLRDAGSPAPAAEQFNRVLHQRESELAAYLDTLIRKTNGQTPQAIFKANTASHRTLYKDKGYVLLMYVGDTLKYWSDNSAAVENYMKEVCLDERLARLRNGWFQVIRKHDNSGRTYIGLSLIRSAYPYQNRYLVNEFWRDYNVPPETNIETNDPGSVNAVVAADGTYLFSLDHKQSSQPIVPLWWRIINVVLNLCGFVLLIKYLHEETHALPDTLSVRWKVILFLTVLAVFRFVMMLLHFPDTFYNSELFSPLHYGDAESFWNSNLGDFFLNALLLLFGVIYVLRHPKSLVINFPQQRASRYLLALFMIAVPVAGGWLINQMIQDLVQNSDISFDVNNIFDLSVFSYLGLLLLALFVATFFLLADHAVIQIKRMQLKFVEQLALFILAATLFTVVCALQDNVDMITVYWPFAILFVLFQRPTDTEESRYPFSLIVLLVFLFSFYTTHMIGKQSRYKEHDSRKLLAEKLAAEQDPIAEHFFIELRDKLMYDTVLIKLSQGPEADLNAFEKRVAQQYFSGYWEKYDVKVAFFDTMCVPLLRHAATYSDNFTLMEEIVHRQCEPTQTEHFYFRTKGDGRISYVAKLVLQWPGREKFLGQGTLFLELDSKLMNEEVGFPELLLDRELTVNQRLLNYSYAKYKNGVLLNHAGKFQFSLSPEQYLAAARKNEFVVQEHYEHLVYSPDNDTAVVLSMPQEGWLNITTGFSYIFTLYSLLLMLALFLRQIIVAGNAFSQLTFKYRIQLVLVLIVLASLTLFGSGSIYYIQQQYQTKNSEIISEKAHSVSLEIESKIEDNKLTAPYKEYTTYLLRKFSNVFFTDINLYDLEGNLFATSRGKVFDEGLVSRKMNPEAYLQLHINKRSEFVHDENVGNLAYLSAYLPVKNKSGELIAYLSLPYFAKQNDLEKEISSFLVALINVYVLLFSLSVIAAIFISNYLTKPLRLIQGKMRAVILGQKNDPINWETNDEIGSLVREYNRMISELAHSAELLAQSERESAWREMAKQVAHEIKNPLTPIRLSLQLLERAYRDKALDLDQKVERLTKTMIEQIDTLSSIATAFSDFAKMPKPQIEEMDLHELLDNVVSLFQETEERIKISYDHGTLDHADVEGDYEQLMRVFNNLIRNAIQAIPEEQDGIVEVKLSREGQHFVVTVKDNGTGISDEVIDKIFVPNFTTKSGGMGLGLAMVKSIVESVNGRIRFETTKGSGTTFYVSIPVRKGDSQ